MRQVSNKILYIILFVLIANYSQSQNSDTAPVLNILSKFDSSTLNVSFNIVARNKISIPKEPSKSLYCDKWFLDIVYILEKFNEDTQKFTAIPCDREVDAVLHSDGTLGELVKLNNSGSSNYYVSIDVSKFGKGKYRLKIKFRYFIEGESRFVESKYVYFDFS